MAYKQNFLRLVVSGTLYTDEQFSWSMAFIQGAGGTAPAPETVPDAVVSAITSFWRWPSLISKFAQIDTVKLNEIGPDGRYVNSETVVREIVGGIVGVADSVIYPPQVALVVSLDTAIRRGRAHGGRFYLPLPGPTLLSSGTLAVAEQEKYVDSATTLIEQLNNALQPWQVGVVSDIGPGAQQRVTHVRVGRVLDTMRSRRRSLDEAYIQGENIVENPIPG
jgi:hypothetical protein